MTDKPNVRFSVWRSLKLGSFHIGSSFGDLLTSAIWNRILISDLGLAAWPVALLSALRYFLAPLTLWAGHRSDTRPLFGSRRVAYIWLGRLLMLLALPLLPLSVVSIARNPTAPLGWGLALASFLLYGAGQLISGAPFLALVHDSAPYEKRGQAIGIVQFMLVVSFAFIPALYAHAMPIYDPTAFTRLVGFGLAGAAVFWFFSVWREERRLPIPTSAAVEPAPSLRRTFAAMLADPRTRRYAVFLATSAFFAFMQDAILEPFGGDVFGLTVGETTRFNMYWGLGVLVSMIAALIVTRRFRPHEQTSTTLLGLAVLALALTALGMVSLFETSAAVRPMLILFGLGFGVFTVGGASLLMAVNTEQHAGAYLALWSVIQLVSRGAGIAMGGVIRDAALALSGQFSAAYAAVFMTEAVGLLVSAALLLRVNVAEFAHSTRGVTTRFEAAVD